MWSWCDAVILLWACTICSCPSSCISLFAWMLTPQNSSWHAHQAYLLVACTCGSCKIVPAFTVLPASCSSVPVWQQSIHRYSLMTTTVKICLISCQALTNPLLLTRQVKQNVPTAYKYGRSFFIPQAGNPFCGLCLVGASPFLGAHWSKTACKWTSELLCS